METQTEQMATELHKRGHDVTVFTKRFGDDDSDVIQYMMIYPVGFLGYVFNKLIGLLYFAWIRGGDYYLMNDVWSKR